MTDLIPVLRARDEHVKFDRIAPAGFRILSALDDLSKVLGMNLWITCGTDSHPPTDPHSTGEAYDLSVQWMTVPQILKAKRFLEQALGMRFTVLYETPLLPPDPALAAVAYVNGNATGPHLHTQRARGTVYPPATPVATP